MSQASIVEAAVEEYVARHAEELEQGIARARAALKVGDDAAVAHMLGVDESTAARIGARRQDSASS
ncbi:MAG: hypothetical protein ACR2MY_11105 [Candidatus Dormibacteria bacterium]